MQSRNTAGDSKDEISRSRFEREIKMISRIAAILNFRHLDELRGGEAAVEGVLELFHGVEKSDSPRHTGHAG